MTLNWNAALRRAWTDAKSWRQIPLGPVSFLFRFARSSSSHRSSLGFTGLTAIPAVNGPPETSLGTVVIVGVSPGFGYGIAEFFSRHARVVALVSRSAVRLDDLVSRLTSSPAQVLAFPCDVTYERQVRRTLDQVTQAAGAPDLLVYAVQNSSPGDVLSTEVAAFEESWRSACLGAFIVAREAARRMLEAGGVRTIVFTGSTSGLVARAGHLNLAVAKHGLRALAQVMARELGPRGIHVVHCVIDADIADGTPSGDPQMSPADLANTILSLHSQASSCWTAELDVRPAKERFWEHC